MLGGLEVGSVFTRVGYRHDETDADAYERRVSKLRRESRKDIVQEARVDADTRGVDRYSRRVRDADRAHGELVRGSGRVRGAMGSLFIGGAGVAGAAVAFTGLYKGVKTTVGAFQESQQVSRQTRAVLKSTGEEAGVTAKHVGALATAISKKTGVDDEAIQSGENLLLTFTNVRNEAGKGNDVFDQGTKLAVDMSKALGTDLSSANIQLGKALNDPVKGITALQRVGVSFTEKQRDQIKGLVEHGKRLDAQKIILRELRKEFGGSAAATATNTAKMSVAIGNVAETIGGKLNPFIERGAGLLTRFIGQIDSGRGVGGKFATFISGAIRKVRGVFEDVFHFIGSVIEDNRDLFDSMGRTVGRVVGNVKRLLAGIADAFRDTFGRGSGTGRDIRNIVRQVLTIIDAVMKVYAAVQRRALPGIIAAFRGLAQIIRGIIRVISGILSGDFGKAWDGVKDIFKGAVKAIGGIIRAGTAPLREAAAAVGRAVGGAFSSAWDKILGVARGFINAIIDVINVIPGVQIGHVGGGGKAIPNQRYGGNLGQTGHLAQGGKVTMPIAIMGEEAPQHPEWVIPTNPAYRDRAVALWAAAARELGIPGFALGGVISDALKTGKSIVNFAGSLPQKAISTAGGVANWLIDRLPGNPGGLLAGAFGWARERAIDFIQSKAKSIFDAITPDISAGGIGVTGGLAPIVLRALAWARSHGWHGTVTSGYRDPAKQQWLWDHASQLGLIRGVSVAAPGTSMHERGLAVDVTDVAGFQRAMASAPANARLYWRGPTDPVHFSTTGHRKGGILGMIGGLLGGEPISLAGMAALGFKKGGRSVLRGVSNRVRRAGRGIGAFEQSISDMERGYGQADRRFGLSDEDFLIEHDDGSVTIDERLRGQRIGELDNLIGRRSAIAQKIRDYRKALRRLIAAIRRGMKRLERAMKAAKGKSRAKERKGYREALRGYGDRLKELRQTYHDLGFDLEDSRIDVDELGGERAGILGERPQAAPPTEPREVDPEAAPASPADIAAAAIAQLTAFNVGRADLFRSFGSNFMTSRSPGLGDPSVAAAGLGAFGAFGTAGLSGAAAAGGVNVQIVNNFGAGPGDPHIWAQGTRREVELAMG